MIPIRFQSENELIEMRAEELERKILLLCKDHFAQNRAYAFAFIFFDFYNPQIAEVLSNFKYWNALDKLSANFLSVFHLHSSDDFFAEDLKRFKGMEIRSMYNLGEHFMALDKLKFFIQPTENITIPSILFFQTDGNKVLDYYVVELKEETIEQSFLEIKSHIASAVKALSEVTPENRIKNKKSIFNLIESGVKANSLKRNFIKKVETFPLNIFLSWITGKL